MKKISFLLLFVAVAAIAVAQSQYAPLPEQMLEGQSCTSIMVGRSASADGSVITSHTCDGRYRTWMRMEPAADHPQGAMHAVYKGTLHTSFASDTTGLRKVGEIPEVPHTYAYLNTAYPCLNEHQLAMGESTFGGPDTLCNPDAMFMIEELQRVALQRCTTARQAILLMGSLAEQYGYADGGECLTIADRDEVWQFEIIGCGRKSKGAVWVARRVPDNAVAVSCNIPRIDTLRRGADDFLCSSNVEQVARRFKLWDGKGTFVFWKAYNTSYAKGRNFLEREYFILNTLAPSLGLSFDAAELPFCVVPEHKVSAAEVSALLRSTYEGTAHDMCANLRMVNRQGDTIVAPVANPWMGGEMRSMLNFLKPGAVEFHRGVSVAWCSYSFVAQMRGWLPDAVGGLLWMSVDNPAESPRVPLFCGNHRLPRAFDLCGHKAYNEQSALWQFRKANRLATVAWQRNKADVDRALDDLQQQSTSGLKTLEETIKSLNSTGASEGRIADLLDAYTFHAYDAAAYRWRELEQRFWERAWAGF